MQKLKLRIRSHAIAVGIIFTMLGAHLEAQVSAHSSNRSGWKLTFSDEFNGRDGSPPNPDKWNIKVGPDGGAKDLEYYTARPDNVVVRGGNLVITASNTPYTSRFGYNAKYTSGRVETQNHFSQAYGRFEARIKLPAGQGMWPAFWMLGANCKQPGIPGGLPWPQCGEIDIMENLGKEPNRVHGTLHGPNYLGGQAGSTFVDPDVEKLSDAFHVYAIEWEPNVIRFYLDDHMYTTMTPSTLPQGAKWIFDHPFYMLLNVAVGGSWGGDPDTTTHFPQTMLVDYVRVYQKR